jgi:hypothetical protein
MAFMVGLTKIDVSPRSTRLVVHPSGNIIKRVLAVDFGLTRSEKIEIRAIQNKNNGPVNQRNSPNNITAAVVDRAFRTLYGDQTKSETK